VPFNTLFFASYRFFSAAIEQHLPGAPGLRAFASGGLAGVAAWSIVFPFDAVKSRLQASGGVSGVGIGSGSGGSGGSGGGGSSGGAVREAARLFSAILREGGVSLLYKGWSAAILRAFPANGALFLGVNTAERLFDKA
jgi:hypothetical protein